MMEERRRMNAKRGIQQLKGNAIVVVTRLSEYEIRCYKRRNSQNKRKNSLLSLKVSIPRSKLKSIFCDRNSSTENVQSKSENSFWLSALQGYLEEMAKRKVTQKKLEKLKKLFGEDSDVDIYNYEVIEKSLPPSEKEIPIIEKVYDVQKPLIRVRDPKFLGIDNPDQGNALCNEVQVKNSNNVGKSPVLVVYKPNVTINIPKSGNEIGVEIEETSTTPQMTFTTNYKNVQRPEDHQQISGEIQLPQDVIIDLTDVIESSTDHEGSSLVPFQNDGQLLNTRSIPSCPSIMSLLRDKNQTQSSVYSAQSFNSDLMAAEPSKAAQMNSNVSSSHPMQIMSQPPNSDNLQNAIQNSPNWWLAIQQSSGVVQHAQNNTSVPSQASQNISQYSSTQTTADRSHCVLQNCNRCPLSMQPSTLQKSASNATQISSYSRQRVNPYALPGQNRMVTQSEQLISNNSYLPSEQLTNIQRSSQKNPSYPIIVHPYGFPGQYRLVPSSGQPNSNQAHMPGEQTSNQIITSNPRHMANPSVSPGQYRPVPSSGQPISNQTCIPGEQTSNQIITSNPRHMANPVLPGQYRPVPSSGQPNSNQTCIPGEQTSNQIIASNPRHMANHSVSPGQYRPVPSSGQPISNQTCIPGEQTSNQRITSNPRYMANHSVLPGLYRPVPSSGQPNSNQAYMPGDQTSNQIITSNPRYMANHSVSPGQYRAVPTPGQPKSSHTYMSGEQMTNPQRNLAENSANTGMASAASNDNSIDHLLESLNTSQPCLPDLSKDPSVQAVFGELNRRVPAISSLINHHGAISMRGRGGGVSRGRPRGSRAS